MYTIPTEEQHIEWQEELSKMRNKFMDLTIKIGNTIGKTKARKFFNHSDKVESEMMECKWALENIGCTDHGKEFYNRMINELEKRREKL